ncbi:DUF2793 domain-containing protein [Lysobacter enzymogenes]|uniref:DUF2793 domain-containing protein n=1 Tax=Lysobacter enzymogenes TaxID=69 RepID=UPI000896BFD1|nr:DUF2793 domain-containing protein [Lysobacter enzymogenes]SDW95372.1 Protein of unknown function [Lysobacter enzymogenes]
MTLPLTFVPQGAAEIEDPINRSLQIIAALCQAGAVALTNTPPTTTLTDVGKVWIVGTVPTGLWAGQANTIALCTAANVWQHLVPGEGWMVRDLAAHTYRYFDGAAWQVFSSGSGSTRDAVSALGTSGSVAVDIALGDYFTLALTGNVTALTFSNLPAVGKGASIMVKITQDSTARTLAWPSSFKWAAGVVPAISTASGAVDLLAISTFDQGTTWQATLAKGFA